jgi:FkbM family methyltransferase
MTDDEMTVLMIAAEGESMAPIGRWKEPLLALTERGLMSASDSVNYVITVKGRSELAREEKLRDGAFAKAVLEQRRENSDLHVHMTVLGREIVFDLVYDPGFIADVMTKRFLEHNGACEPETVHLMRRVLRTGDFAIDGGANIGFFTMVMSRLVGDSSTGSEGHVEAFEPSTVNFKKLRINVERSHAENVTVINRALWSEDSQVTLHQPADTGMSSLAPLQGTLNRTPVGGLTLDKWCLAYDQKPRLLKLDIEGAELHALIGAGQLLTRGIDFVCCEMNLPALDRFGASQMDLRDYMAGKGYTTFELRQDGGRPVPVARDRRLVPEVQNFNVLFSTVERVHEAWEQPLL